MQLIKKLVVNLIFYCDPGWIKKNNIPKIIVTIDAPKKDESISLYKNCAITGINIKIPRII